MKRILFPFTVVLITQLLSCAKSTSDLSPVSTPLAKPVKSEIEQGWEGEWQNILREARKEGRVVVFGPPGADARKVLTEGFHKSYPGIKVEYVGGPGAALVPKIKAERNAGIYNIDLFLAGTTTILTETMKFAMPMEPLFILPEVKDKKYWLDQKHDFADFAGKFNLVFAVYAKTAMVYNPSLLDPRKAEMMSYWELTKPEFKGKVITKDPRILGPGQATFMFLYVNPQLGPDMIKAMVKNEIILSRDDRQILEFVGKGRYTVAIGHSELILSDLVEAGLQTLKVQESLKEGTYITAGFSSIMSFNRAPHPYATKAFLNWLLSKDGQRAWSSLTRYPSRRLDVNKEGLYPEPRPGISYINSYNEEAMEIKEKVVALALEIFGR